MADQTTLNEVRELSESFETLLNSYSTSPEHGHQSSPIDINLNEYEKSLFLTQAQDQIVREIYSGTALQFEVTEEARRYLNNLVTQKNCDEDITAVVLIDKYNHTSYILPDDCWYIIYEQAQYLDEDNPCLVGYVADVVPVTHDEYQRTIRNPFRGINKRRVLRLDRGDNRVELVSNYPVDRYTIRYIKQPTPIILEDLEGNLKIRQENTVISSILPKSLHFELLERAVKLALTSKIKSTK